MAPFTDGLLDLKIKLSRGRFLGGSSGVNGTLCIRGAKQDYDDWDLPGWSGEEFFAAMRKAETFHNKVPVAFAHSERAFTERKLYSHGSMLHLVNMANPVLSTSSLTILHQSQICLWSRSNHKACHIMLICLPLAMSHMAAVMLPALITRVFVSLQLCFSRAITRRKADMIC